jgi:hypothetical protein
MFYLDEDTKALIEIIKFLIKYKSEILFLIRILIKKLESLKKKLLASRSIRK